MRKLSDSRIRIGMWIGGLPQKDKCNVQGEAIWDMMIVVSLPNPSNIA
jgi:hypothetical protein